MTRPLKREMTWREAVQHGNRKFAYWSWLDGLDWEGVFAAAGSYKVEKLVTYKSLCNERYIIHETNFCSRIYLL